MKRTYRWKFHFNAAHNITPENENGRHAHSFLVVLYMEIKEFNLEKQNACEKVLQEYLNQYNGKYLNEMEKFSGRIPTLEVICEVLSKDTKKIATKYGMKQLQIEVGDSPVALVGIGKVMV